MISAADTVKGQNLGPLDQIPLGEGRSFRLPGGEEIAVFRTRTGDLFAVQSHCPHRRGPLADGLIGDGRVVCPLHGYAFRLATGEALREECDALRTYPVSLTPAGELVVELATPAGAEPSPKDSPGR
jgi:nitrite reductase (NADH) small subunit